MHRPIHNITHTAIFMALGILFPVLFHQLGLGPMLLPMFWPLVIAAFFVKPVYSIFAGILTPLLSSLLAGMPPVPFLYIMIIELAILTLTLGLLYHTTRLGGFWIVLIGMFISRLILYVISMWFGPLIGLPDHFSGIGMVIKSLPGALAITIGAPLLLVRLHRTTLFQFRKSNVQRSPGIF